MNVSLEFTRSDVLENQPSQPTRLSFPVISKPMSRKYKLAVIQIMTCEAV